MEVINIIPNEGIGKIKLGMERSRVYQELNQQGDFNSRIEWIGDYHIEYRDDKVVFIEVSNSLGDRNFVLFNGIDIFKTEVKILVKFICEYGEYDDKDSELGYTYSFPSLGMGFWRPIIFEYDMVQDPEFIELDEESQMYEAKYLFFESACVFVEDYYDRE